MIQPYKPPAGDLLRDSGGVFEAVSLHLSAQIPWLGPPEKYLAHVLSWPQAARVIWGLWHLTAEAGGNGLIGYLNNHSTCTTEVKLVHAAVSAIDSGDILRAVETAIAFVAGTTDPEFGAYHFATPAGKEWCARFGPAPEIDVDAFDSKAIAMVDEVYSRAERYTVEHFEELLTY